MTGLVYKSTGSWYTVKSLQGDFMECRIKGKFRIKGIKKYQSNCGWRYCRL